MPANTIKVSSVTELQRDKVRDGQATFKEVHYGWETGNVVTAPATATQEEVIAAYREQFPSA